MSIIVMSDDDFEKNMDFLASQFNPVLADSFRHRDTAQREALARVEADYEANSLEYGEALILIGQVLDCRSLEDLNAVRRYLNEFMDRYSLRPVPDVDLVQAEQQEAQGAQAGEFKRERRYMVIKLNKLADDQGANMSRREQIFRIAHFGRAMVECVVVESDWPEYEPTWAAIQARVECGKRGNDHDQ